MTCPLTNSSYSINPNASAPSELLCSRDQRNPTNQPAPLSYIPPQVDNTSNSNSLSERRITPKDCNDQSLDSLQRESSRVFSAADAYCKSSSQLSSTHSQMGSFKEEVPTVKSEGSLNENRSTPVPTSMTTTEILRQRTRQHNKEETLAENNAASSIHESVQT